MTDGPGTPLLDLTGKWVARKEEAGHGYLKVTNAHHEKSQEHEEDIAEEIIEFQPLTDELNNLERRLYAFWIDDGGCRELDDIPESLVKQRE